MLLNIVVIQVAAKHDKLSNQSKVKTISSK